MKLIKIRRPKQMVVIGLLAATVTLVGCKREEVVARVNGHAITAKEFDQQCQDVNVRDLDIVAQQGHLLTAGQVALSDLINYELAVQLAKKDKVTPTPQQISAEMAFARKFPNQSGLFPGTTNAELNRLVTFSRSLLNIATQGITVTPQEIQQYYQQNKAGFTMPETYHLRAIEMADPSKVKEALASLKSGVAFQSVAMQLSDDPASRSKNGDIGLQTQATMPPPLYNAVQKLKPGQYTNPIKLVANASGPTGSHPVTVYVIAQLVDEIPAMLQPLSDVQVEIEHTLLSQKVPNLAQRESTMLSDFRKQSKIEIYLKKYQNLLQPQPAAAP
ncbi:MAG: peptidyl-prolyl cis-trans isomerase [Armatimonadetes bacterium]|nr:peptidyl-prolyl cis-trans isomerase [Armatimonadota bacterium]